MKHFAMISFAALLISGFYAMGSTSPHRSANADQMKTSLAVTDTVPRRGDTMNKRMPRDTTMRRDTLNRRDSLQ